jgi:hypothetical protein
LATLDFSAFKEIGTQMKADAAAARKDIDAFTDRILNARKNAAEIDALDVEIPQKLETRRRHEPQRLRPQQKKLQKSF